MIHDSTGIEQVRFQERDPFEDFLDHPGFAVQRRAATEQEQEKMDASLKKLQQIFSRVPEGWNVDGALNISFITGDYIGVHKDVDISIEPAHIERIEAELRSSGYGLFLSYPKDTKNPRGPKVMERVRHNSFTSEQAEHLMIAAVDERGKISESDSLDFLDTHLIKRNNSGVSIGHGGVELPESWQKSRQYLFRGMPITGAHPAKVAYYKLHEVRAYDDRDLEILAKSGALSRDEIMDVARVCEREMTDRESMVTGWVRGILLSVKTVSDSAEDIFAKMISDPRVAIHLDRLAAPLKSLADIIASGVSDAPRLEQRALELLGVSEESAGLRSRVARFVGWVVSDERLKKVEAARQHEIK